MKQEKILNSNYEIKNLLSIKKYNQISTNFKGKIYKKVIMLRTFKIDDSKPIIKSINKIRVNVKNLCYTIINTGTEKKLQIQGVLCQDISYFSDTSICYINFFINFNEYLPLDKEIDIDKDKFDIYPCIENVFITTINEKTIITNTTLYLYVYKIDFQIEPIPPKQIYNKIVVKSKLYEKMVEIEINQDKGILLVTSTGIKPDPLSKEEEYFKFILRDRFGKEVISSTINSDEDGEIFKKLINYQEITTNDSIEISCFKTDAIEISNYPKLGDMYIIKNKKEMFLISNMGLKEYLYPNEIVIKNNNKEEVAKVQFNIKENLLVVASTQIQSTNNFDITEEYLAFILLNKDLNIKNEGIIKRRETAYSFEKTLNNKNFSNGNIVKLRYKNRENIFITNYKCKRNYNPKGRFEFFIINENNLSPYKLSFANNFIRLKNQDNSSVIDILFGNYEKILIIDSTGIKNINSEYFSFKLMDSSEKQKKYFITLYKNETGDKMMQSLDNMKFEYGDILELTYPNNNLVHIINYPILNNSYIPLKNHEKFIITPKGIISFILPSRIIVKNNSNQIIAMIAFNIRDKIFKVEATNNIADKNLGDNIYFSLEVINNIMLTKRLITIKGNENGQNFAKKLDNKSFKEEDVIRLTFANPNKIEVTNFPVLENMVYIPKEKEENLELALNRLNHYHKTLRNIITCISNNKPIATIAFNINQNKLIVNSTNTIASCFGFSPYLSFEIFRGNIKILNELIDCSQTAKSFASKVTGFQFNYNDEIAIQLLLPNKAIITNFNGIGQNLEVSTVRLIITPTGLKIK